MDNSPLEPLSPFMQEIANQALRNYFEQIKDTAAMPENVILELLPGVHLVVDTDKFNIENNFSLGGFSEGADIKVYVDVRLVDVITKEQSKAESLVILRTK